jgi:hypothetical protein
VLSTADVIGVEVEYMAVVRDIDSRDDLAEVH